MVKDIPADLPRRPRGDRIRRTLPELAARMTELVVDNPWQIALLLAGAITVTAAARNVVRPRTALEALALAAVLEAGCAYGTSYVITAGVIPFKVRDEHGELVPAAVDRACRADTAA